MIDSHAFLDEVARRHQALIAHRPLLNTLQRKPALLGRADERPTVRETTHLQKWMPFVYWEQMMTYSLDCKEGLAKKKFVCLFVGFLVEVKGTLSARRQAVITFDAHRGNSMWGTRIWGPLASKPHWSTRNQWKSSFLKTRYSGVCRCGKHESGAQIPGKPMIHRKPMEIELAGKFLSILDRKKSCHPQFTSHLGRGLERVDTGITRTTREWLIDETSLSRNYFLWSKTTSNARLWTRWTLSRTNPFLRAWVNHAQVTLGATYRKIHDTGESD